MSRKLCSEQERMQRLSWSLPLIMVAFAACFVLVLATSRYGS